MDSCINVCYAVSPVFFIQYILISLFVFDEMRILVWIIYLDINFLKKQIKTKSLSRDQ